MPDNNQLFLLWALMLAGRVRLNRKGYAEVSVFSHDWELLQWFKGQFGGSVMRGLKSSRWMLECKAARELLVGLPTEQMTARLREQVESVLAVELRKPGRPKRETV